MGFKDKARKLIYGFAVATEEEMRTEIEKTACVSFDVFDTLIKRDIGEPKAVFTYLEQLIDEDETSNIIGFAKLRINAERQARKKHSGREVTLSEIYEYISEIEAEKQYLMQIECQAEIDLSIVNQLLKPLYDLCLEKEKPIYFISDMYLPKEVVAKILHKNGYRDGKLFVSSENGFTKRSGKLFEYVRETEKISCRDWLHIGDGIRGDFLIPRQMGIRACLVERNQRDHRGMGKGLRNDSGDEAL